MPEPAPERTPPDDTTGQDAASAIGRRIRAARERRGWSQADLASHTERTQTAVSYWESGKRLIGVDDLARVAAVLNVPASALLPDSAPPDDPATTEDRYWQAEAKRARAERDALALRLLQMADAWEDRFTETGVRVAVVAEAVRTAVENAGGH